MSEWTRSLIDAQSNLVLELSKRRLQHPKTGRSIDWSMLLTGAETERTNPMKARITAFSHALRGGATLLRTQPHAQFHAVAALIVLGLAGYLRVSHVEWALLIVAISLVWIAEAINTAIEFLADEVSIEWRERIKHAKDIAAFAVLVAAISAAVVGGVVFIPHLLTR
ncbi:MAG: diacylglycerol kinase family protein [Verrucomicrobiales bacterium]|nr:diacylglycerol kinase family protein [Verrucomicrobiales bacterium]